MTRWQIRPFYSEQERAKIYNRTYDHTWWPDHIERVTKTAQLLGDFARTTGAQTIADLSCGDGAIISSVVPLSSDLPWQEIHMGDLVPPRPLTDAPVVVCYLGPIEKTIEQIPPVDLFLCSETLEHVEDPDALLRSIRDKAQHLLLTTPHGENHARNPEHYWSWEREDISDMLWDAGWQHQECQLWTPTYEHPDTYTFQMWTAS